MRIPQFYDSIGIRVISFFQIQRGEQSINNEQSTQHRHELAIQALNWFAQSPLIGNGIGSFPSYHKNVLGGAYFFSNCNYTEILSGLGVLGFLFYYGIFGYALHAVFRTQNNSSYKIILAALIIEYLIGDFGLVVYYEKITWILIAIIAGLVTKVKYYTAENEIIVYQ